MFIPATMKEAASLGWDRFDVILVTGDACIDSPLMGISVIGHVLMDRGYRVGIIPQPKLEDGGDISRLGEPRLFWGVTAGSVDSMVSNYNADRSRRRHDDFTPGGKPGRRPDRASIAYSNLIRRHFKNTVPIVLGGVEASLRRVPHYDYWDNTIRRSVLFDAKADYLVYGMGELAVTELARALDKRGDPAAVPGLCHITREKPAGFHELPSYEEVRDDPGRFTDMFMQFMDWDGGGPGLAVRHGDRFLAHNRPQPPLASAGLDRVYSLPFEREIHPIHKGAGGVTALDTIRFSMVTHRGCVGRCNFCSIAAHEGCSLVSRSEESILEEIRTLSRHPRFKGIIADLGGATANMYGMDCPSGAPCSRRRCLSPSPCGKGNFSHSRLIGLLRSARAIPGVKKIFVSSGVRYDLVMRDREHGREYLEELVAHHLSGRLRIAPEHTEIGVLSLMGKPAAKELAEFIALFRSLNMHHGKRQHLMFYCMAAHPGCTEDDMKAMAGELSGIDRTVPSQVQIFTPTPSTLSTLMYYTGIDPFTGKKIFVERDMGKKKRQQIIFSIKEST